jgi:hypothetical protein
MGLRIRPNDIGNPVLQLCPWETPQENNLRTPAGQVVSPAGRPEFTNLQWINVELTIRLNL